MNLAEKRAALDVKDIYRGEIWYIRFPNAEINEECSPQLGRRPAVVIQSNNGSKSNLLLVAPISKAVKKKDYPFLQKIVVKAPSFIHYEHIRPVTRSCFENFIRCMTKEEMREMDLRISVPLGIESCNFLHIEYVRVVNKTEISEGVYLFSGYIKKRFGAVKFTFLESEFTSVFPNIPTDNFIYMSKALESLEGLKFVYEHIERLGV